MKADRRLLIRTVHWMRQWEESFPTPVSLDNKWKGLTLHSKRTKALSTWICWAWPHWWEWSILDTVGVLVGPTQPNTRKREINRCDRRQIACQLCSHAPWSSARITYWYRCPSNGQYFSLPSVIMVAMKVALSRLVHVLPIGVMSCCLKFVVRNRTRYYIKLPPQHLCFKRSNNNLLRH